MAQGLSPSFTSNIHRVFGDAGRDWLADFPRILERCRERWGLTLGEPIPNLSVNYITFAVTGDGEEVMLKVGVLPHEVRAEIETLRLYDGRRMVRCLDADFELCAFLLERLQPGQMLTSVGDNAEETRIAADMMKTLPVPCPAGNGLPTFAGWIEKAFARLRRVYGPECGPLGRHLVEQAEAAFTAIQAAKRPQVLLHGDLHHENILFDERRGWTAIDPKGVLGDAVLETGRLQNNQLPNTLPLPEKQHLIEERIDILSSELGESEECILLAFFVDRVLSLSWSLEDSELTNDFYHGRDVAALLGAMLDSK
ncbi:MAG: aminoglycoside phosphotransferase family protein [Armatimonadota bacterium]